MAKERTVSAEGLIAEEELLSSSAERVFDWFKSRSLTKGRIEENLLDEEVELKLLARNERLIDLAISYYGIHCEALQEIFKKALENKNEALILACLSNTSIGKAAYSISQIPYALVKKDELIIDWLKGSSREQIYTLFTNEYISDDFLTKFLENKEAWQVLDDDRRLSALSGLYKNTRMTSKYDGYMDGMSEFLHNNVFFSAWKLAETVPVTKMYAARLGMLYTRLYNERYEFDSMNVAKRWMIEDEDEKKDKKKTRLNLFELIRQGIYKDVVLKKFGNDDISKYIKDDDIALRSASYLLSDLTTEQIEEAYERDNLIAIENLLENLNVWRDEHKRDLLKALCWNADEKYNDNWLNCANDYKYAEERMIKKYPSLFKNKEYEPDVSNDDLPVTVGYFREMLSEESYKTTELSNEVIRLKQDAKNIRWWVIVCFVLLLILVFR